MYTYTSYEARLIPTRLHWIHSRFPLAPRAAQRRQNPFTRINSNLDLMTYVALQDKLVAETFERYLKLAPAGPLRKGTFKASACVCVHGYSTKSKIY